MTDQQAGTARQGRSARFSSWLRQLSYPKDVRIGAATWPPAMHDVLRRIEALRTELVPAPDPTEPAGPDPASTHDAALVDAAMGLWRTQRRLDGLDGADAALARSLRRHMTVAWKGLAQMDVEVQDHEQEPFDSGLPLEALAIQPEPGLTRETIIETVAPTILRSGRRIQMGQVIVGRPKEATDA
jgi:hypothetical protein